MAIITIPPTFYQVAFNADPNQSVIPPYWTDQSWRVQFPWDSGRGRQYELDAVETGEWRPTLANPDGALDPSNTGGAYYPNVLPLRQARIICKPGPNQLTIDQATAGEGSGYPPGPVPAQMQIACGAGYPLTIAASGSAYQGAQVYQVAVPNGAAQPQNLLNLVFADALVGSTYSAQVQARVLATAQNLTVSVAIDWINSSGAVISTSAGTGVALAGGSTSWVQLTASGTAPTGTQYCTIRAVLGTTTTATASAQFDGLQFENNYFPTPYQTPFTVPANMLPGNLASGGYDNQTATGWWYPSAGSVAYATGLAAAPTGHTNAFAWTTPASTTSAAPLLAGAAASGPAADISQVTAGTAYTVSFYALRAASADVTLAITPTITWYNAPAAAISTNVGPPLTLATGSWGRAAVSGTAPAGALWGRLSFAITTPASTTASNVVYLTAGQFEAAGSASPWRDTGTTYSIITPFIERWPQTWDEQDGTYGTSPVVGDDAFVALAQYTLADPFVEEVLALAPNFLFRLSDPAGSTSCTDGAGKRPAAPIETAPFGPGSLTFGNSVTSTTAAGSFIGASGSVATFANNATQNPPSQVQFAETFISLHKTTTTPGPPTSGAWTRMIAFRASAAPGTNKAYTLWDAEPPSWSTNASLCSFAINNLGQANIQWSDFAGTGAWDYTGTANLCDGNWHLLAIGNNPAGVGTVVWVDGAVVSTAPGATGSPAGITTDALGCSISTGRQWYDGGLIGDLAFACEFPTLLSSAQMTALYQSWRNASSGESTGARVSRILRWIGWTGPSAIDAGQTPSMGPATDLTGATALDAANNVALTENGTWYAAANGTLTFKSRAARYNQTTPLYVFGENVTAGEWPFENPFQFDDDSSHITGNVQVTQYGGSLYTAIDATSGGRYFPRIYQRTVNSTSTNECQDAANYLLRQYKDPHMRVSALRLHPSAVPGLFLVCLNLEIGTRIRVNRHPSGAPQITFDGYVEKIEWSWDPEAGDVWVNLQCSPADLSAYWLVGAAHTTLNAQAASGQAQATINALPDAAVNMLSQSLPQGYQLVFEPGTPRQETMTLAPTGIPATSLGYLTATLTFTSTFAFTHPAGSVVTEPLPAGVSDPTTYDANAVLGASSCAVLSGGASGTNTITVGPLPDAKTNALSSDWNTGDLLSISPGPATWEGYNLLTPNQATAGEGALPLAAGTNGSVVAVTSALGTASVAASGTAWQGANVWQVPISGGAGLFRAIRVVLTPAAPGLAHTFSAYARSATAGANPSLNAQIIYVDASGNTLSTTNGSTSTLTGGPAAAWTRVTATATAPAGTVWAALGVPLSGTSPASSWTFQADGLQFEQAASASAFNVTPQVKSVATVPGYASVQITLNTNLLNSHAAGDLVCDPLPPGVTAPPAGTMRIAY